MSTDRAHRLWRLAKLQVPQKRPRRRVAASFALARLLPRVRTRSGRTTSSSTSCANGQKLKYLTVIDEFTREALAIDVAGSILFALCHRRFRPADQQSMARPSLCATEHELQFVSLAIMRWLTDASIQTALHRPAQALAERSERELQRQASATSA